MFGSKKNSGAGADDESGLLSGMKMKAVEKAAPNHSLCPNLTLRQRLYGFTICFGIGMILSILSTGMLFRLLSGQIVKFAVLYTLGIIVSLSSSMFLWGPKRQCKAMFDKKRRWTTIIFLSCIVAIIALAVLIGFGISFNGIGGVVLLLVIV